MLLEKTFRLRVRRSLRSSSKSSSSKLSVLLKLARTSARAFCCIVPGPNHPRITLDVSCSLRYPNPHRALSSPVKTRAMSDPMKLDATLSGDSPETMDERSRTSIPPTTALNGFEIGIMWRLRASYGTWGWRPSTATSSSSRRSLGTFF